MPSLVELLQERVRAHYPAGVPSSVLPLLADLEEALAEREAPELVGMGQTLGELAVAVGHLELDEAVRRFTEVSARTLRASRVGLWLFDADQQLVLVDVFELVEGTHSGGEVLKREDFPKYFKAIQRGRVIAAAHAAEDPATAEFKEGYLAATQVVSLLDVPVRVEGEVVGVICNEQRGSPRRWTPAEQSFAASVGDLAAQVLERNRRKRAEEDRAHLQESLRQAQKMEAVGLLAGGVAHDFNNLLTPILACAQGLLASPRPEDVDELEDIVAAAREAKALTGQLLAFGRKQVLDVRPLDLGEELRRVRKLLARVLPETIEIDVDVPSGLPPVLADATQLHLIMMNLSINARDAMPKGGRLSFAARRGPSPDQLLIRVEDDGLGMDPSILPRIFEPFFTTKSLGRGTGLGLATVYGVVQQHGGSVRVDSSPGMGTTFEILLPVADVPPSSQTVEAVGAAGRVRACTVLVVEDEPLVRRVLRRALERRGHTAVVLGSAEEAFAYLGEMARPPDVLVTDVVLPGMSGPGLAQRLRERHPRLPVLFISGHARDAMGPRDRVPGSQFLQKPFTLAELVIQVEALIPVAPGG